MAFLLSAFSAGAQPALTGICAFETDGSGNQNGGFWNTLGGDGPWNLYVIQGAPGGAFVNSGDGAATSISIPLAAGTYTYTAQGDHYATGSYRGINLFFDGDNATPRISVFEQLGVTGGQADGGNTYELDGTGVTGAGTLACYVDGYRVRLTSYRVDTSVPGSDRVSEHDNTPNQAAPVDDDLITFTLTVEQMPVPALGTAGLAALALLVAAAGLVALRRVG